MVRIFGGLKSTLPHPQMSDDEIRVLSGFSANFETLIEFGSGASTVLWSRHFSRVVSVESRFSWFHIVKQWLAAEDARNVDLIFSPPESKAFDVAGREIWNAREPSDYGTLAEFAEYFRLASEVIAAHSRALVFLDGHLRREIAQFALDINPARPVLLHDVTPERDYLNNWIASPPYSAMQLADTLYAVTCISASDGSGALRQNTNIN